MKGIECRPPEAYPDRIQPSIVPSSSNTSQACATSSILVSRGFSSPPALPASPLSSPGTPLPSPESHVAITPSAPQEDIHNAIPPSQVQDEAQDTRPPPQVTREGDSTPQVFPSQTVEPLSTDFGETVGSGLMTSLLFGFAFWLKHRVEAGNTYMEVCLEYVSRCRRALLNRTFALQPRIFRVYLIVESSILSLHIATLLLTCMMYIEEALQLATQMEPEIVA